MQLKKNARLACLLLLSVSGNAIFSQTVERDVLANAGGTALITDSMTVTWTLGETFVATRNSGQPQIIVTEGFHQPEDTIPITIPTIELPDTGGKVTISPNPTNGMLDITLSTLPNAPLHVTLSDLSGRILREIRITDLTSTLDLQGLPAAIYILSLSDGKQWVRSMKVVKQ